MARMITLHPAHEVRVTDQVTIVASAAGLFSTGLRVCVYIFNEKILHSDTVDITTQSGRHAFAPALMQHAAVSEDTALTALLELAEASEGVLRQIEQDEKRPRGDSKDRPGTSLASCVHIPEPCTDPVDGHVLAGEVKDIFKRHVILPPGAAVALTLWVIFTYALAAFDVSPMVFLYSPLPACGKSLVLALIQSLSYRGMMAANISTAGFFRVVEALTPTICLDEIDTYLREREELRGVINSGHSRTTAYVIRVDGDSMEPRAYSTWCAKALAGIGLKSLGDAPRSRSIQIEMQKKMPDQKVAPLRVKTLEAYQRQVGSLCSRWAQDNLDALSETFPSLPDGLSDRAADNWEPLLAIAERLGGKWPEHAKKAIEALEQPVLDEDDIKLRLLSDLRDIFDKHGNRIFSRDIVEQLHQMEESPWTSYGRGQKPLSASQLASLLKPFGINSNSMDLKDPETGKIISAKGYKLEDCEPVFSRYLPSRNVGTSKPSNDAGNRGFQNVGSEDAPTFEKDEIPSNDEVSDVPTFKKPPQPEKRNFEGENQWDEEVF